MGFILDIFGAGPATKAARANAEATIAAAKQQAQSDRYGVQAAQKTTETMLAQEKAAQAASELLSKPQSAVDVKLAAGTDAASIDPATNRRRTTRAKFSPQAQSSGLKI